MYNANQPGNQGHSWQSMQGMQMQAPSNGTSMPHAQYTQAQYTQAPYAQIPQGQAATADTARGSTVVGDLMKQAKLSLGVGGLAVVGAIAFVGYVQVTHKTQVVVDNPTSAPMTVKAYGVTATIEAGKTGVLAIGDSGEGTFEATSGGKAGTPVKMDIPRLKIRAWLASSAYVYIASDAKRTIAMVPMSYGTANGGEPQVFKPGLNPVANLDTFDVDAAFPASVSLQQTKNSKPTGKVLRHLCHVSAAAGDELTIGCPGAG